MATTTNYGWTTPDDTALVKDGAAAIRTLGSSVDTTTKALNPETTLGDIAYRSSTANVKTRLALGTANQQLRVNSGATAPEWFTPVAGGMTLLETLSFSGASVTSSSIAGTYKNLEIIVRNFKPDSDQRLNMRFNGDTATNYCLVTGNNEDNKSVNATFAITGDAQDSATATGLFQAFIPDYANATTIKMLLSYSITNNTVTPTNYQMNRYANVYNQTGAITTITFLPNSGNFTSGTALIYGVN
jgi:hypothetical protein